MDSWTFKYTSRGQQDYEECRTAGVWNARIPHRYPEVIAYPEKDEDVQIIVQYAAKHGFTIATKSGGHSWSASFLRDGGVLIDMCKMNNYSFDKDARTAEVQPGLHGAVLNHAVSASGLMFPVGHCPTVALGGYLLQGGMGWNSRKWGFACESVTAIDVINADGDLIHASNTENTEFLWAARGSGCGFFGVVTRFYLRLHPIPGGISSSRYVFEIADLDEVLMALGAVSDQIPACLEMITLIAHDQDGFLGRPTAVVAADALAETPEEAKRALDILHNIPVMSKSIKSYPFMECTIQEMFDKYEQLAVKGGRYEVNGVWVNAPMETLLPRIHSIVNVLPPLPSHVYLSWWLPHQPRPDMAFSMEARYYISINIIHEDPSRDARYAKLPVDILGSSQDYVQGTSLADENLANDPGKFMSLHNYRRLEELRRKHDPEGRFYGYPRLPLEFEQIRSSL
ncbi:hypothetical protein HFD88_010679 [Aspergillus terreus]|nr:hypothetical protein HFD88_010679 [Aspergillus terreus]